MGRTAAKKKIEAPPAPPGILLTMQPGATPDPVPDGFPDNDLTDEQAAELAAIEDRFEGIPGDTPVEIYRYQEDGDLGFCGRLPAHTFSPQEVARRWHTSGKYRAICRVKDKKTGQVVKGGIRVKVFTLDDMAVAEYVAAEIPAPAPAGPSTDLTMATALAGLLASVTQAMGNMLQTKAEPVDPLAMLNAISGIVKDMHPATPAGPAQDFGAMVATMNDILDLKERTSPPPVDEDPLMRIARENVPRLLGILEKAQGANPDAARMLAELKAKALAGATMPAPVTAPTAGLAPATAEEPPMWQMALAARKAHLLQMAQRDKDPQTNAEYEYMLMEGTAVVGQFKVFLSRPYADVVQDIFAAAPEFRSYEGWTVIFIVQLQELFGLVPDGTVEALMEEGPDEPEKEVVDPVMHHPGGGTDGDPTT